MFVCHQLEEEKNELSQIGDYIHLDRTYVLSSDIRAKLGMKGSSEQLGKYIQNLLLQQG